METNETAVDTKSRSEAPEAAVDGEHEAKEAEAVLSREAATVARHSEVQRVLDAMRLDAYHIFGLEPNASAELVQKQFRKKSLLVHPDKNDDPRAGEAFEVLKTAHSALVNEKSRKYLDQVYADAQQMTLREQGWAQDDPRTREADFSVNCQQKAHDLLLEDEIRRRQRRQAEQAKEGAARREKEAAAEAKKRKQLQQELWDSQQDQRVESWRKFKRQKVKSKSTLG